MLIVEWTNKNVTESDLFIKLDKDEMDKLESLFPEIRKAWHKVLDSAYVFVNREKKTITPLNDISLAFGGQYNGYPPYGNEIDAEIDFTELTWVQYTEIEQERIKRYKR